MAPWTAFPYPLYPFDADAVRAQWPRLHQGDAEPLPADPAVLGAWALFHAGDFRGAFDAGLAAGGGGITAANKAQVIYADSLEPSEKTRLELLLQAAERAEQQCLREPDNANAHYLMAAALSRYGQNMPVAKAVAQGLGARVKAGLEAALRLEPAHADAHVALGSFHAEVIDKVGALMGRTQGASVEAGLRHFRQALQLHPDSVVGRIEYARGLLILEGDKRLADAERLYAEAADTVPADAAERLGVERARSELLE